MERFEANLHDDFFLFFFTDGTFGRIHFSAAFDGAFEANWPMVAKTNPEDAFFLET